MHRIGVASCESRLPRADFDAGEGHGCRKDADCTAAKHGFCEGAGVQVLMYECNYGCTSDGDCPGKQACACGPDIGICLSGDCRNDADCATGQMCLSYDDPGECLDGGPGSSGFACTAPGDECLGAEDCGDGMRCIPFHDGHRKCAETTVCGIGRPFLIDGAPRVAPLTGPGPRAGATGDADGLSAIERRALAAHWERTAQLEHASVAAFARLAGQLMALGAPAELLAACLQAGSDEAHHTRLALELARRHGSLAPGFGPLDVEDAHEGANPAAMLVAAVIEGCVGETLAAAEARLAADRARDPWARSVLECIAQDELRHAAFSFRLVAFLRERVGPSAAHLIEHALGRVDLGTGHSLDSDALRANGWVSATERHELQRAMFDAVVRPGLDPASSTTGG